MVVKIDLIKMVQIKLFQKVKNVFNKYIIRFGNTQEKFVIEARREHNLT